MICLLVYECVEVYEVESSVKLHFSSTLSKHDFSSCLRVECLLFLFGMICSGRMSEVLAVNCRMFTSKSDRLREFKNCSISLKSKSGCVWIANGHFQTELLPKNVKDMLQNDKTFVVGAFLVDRIAEGKAFTTLNDMDVFFCWWGQTRFVFVCSVRYSNWFGGPVSYRCTSGLL